MLYQLRIESEQSGAKEKENNGRGRPVNTRADKTHTHARIHTLIYIHSLVLYSLIHVVASLLLFSSILLRTSTNLPSYDGSQFRTQSSGHKRIYVQLEHVCMLNLLPFTHSLLAPRSATTHPLTKREKKREVSSFT